jgi:D-arabinitol 4-dehydrogenase
MVDRITPRPSAETIARIRGAVGWADECPVMAESFIQWVVEDHFVAGRPPWDKAGVEFTDSVLPFEEAKIRILNSSHSAIAWAGTLKGYKFIHEGALDPDIARIAFNYVTDDVIPVLTPSPIDLPKYRDAVLERFSNPSIQDTNQRVAADGYSKIPGFLVPTFQQRLAAQKSVASVAMLPALFLLFLRHWADGRLDYVYQDQAMDAEAARLIVASPDPVHAFSESKLLWGELAGDARLQSALAAAYQRVLAQFTAR